MTALALTDRDTDAGTVRFAQACSDAGIPPVFGVDVAVAPHRRRPRSPVRDGAHVLEPPLRITLLARNASGWTRLCRLVSAAHAQADVGRPILSWPSLREFANQDLVVILGPSSEPVRALAAGRPDRAEQLLAPWRELAGTGCGWRRCDWDVRALARGRCAWLRGPWAWPTSSVSARC